MTQRLFVTLGFHGRKERTVLEMPGDLPIREWIADLVKAADWDWCAGAAPDGFRLETEEGEPLESEQTLLDAGITSSDMLFLAKREGPKFPLVHGDPPDTGMEKDGTNSSGSAASSGLSLYEIARKTRLTGPQGLVILLGEPPLTIGRAGKQTAPDIDLSEWDTGVIASRKHATIERIEDDFILRPERTTNGTFLNGAEVPAGECRHLRNGDRVQFGFGGLELRFFRPEM
jgi:hypothetical protein